MVIGWGRVKPDAATKNALYVGTNEFPARAIGSPVLCALVSQRGKDESGRRRMITRHGRIEGHSG